MLHKAWNSKGEVPYCFPRSSIKFQGHTGQNITDFDPNWAFPDYRPVAAFKSLRFALFLIAHLPSLISWRTKMALHPEFHFISVLVPDRSDTFWWHRTWSVLVQVMACCLTAPSHYLNQCWVIISEALWHSPEGNFKGNPQEILEWVNEWISVTAFLRTLIKAHVIHKPYDHNIFIKITVLPHIYNT